MGGIAYRSLGTAYQSFGTAYRGAGETGRRLGTDGETATRGIEGSILPSPFLALSPAVSMTPLAGAAPSSPMAAALARATGGSLVFCLPVVLALLGLYAKG
jgi:hypothetical protein